MMQENMYFSLGATLYTPCTHDKLSQIMSNGLGSKSMVFCTEDAVSDDQLKLSLDNLRNALLVLEDNSKFKRFIRPRNALVLKEILGFDGIEKIDGFVLPKYDLTTLNEYHDVLISSSHPFKVMPTLESSEVMCPKNLVLIREQLNSIKDRIICLRIGGNDLFNILGIKRMPGQTIYDTPLRIIIEQLIITFRPHGYELSAPVFDFLEDRVTLEKELRMDLNFGFFGKTAIHPEQVTVIENFFHDYSSGYIKQAESILDQSSPAIYQMSGQMMETACHRNWAQRTKHLANSFNYY
ncbi:HpcH/HpaI aldolase/citrate lyase family protein [Vibrio neptunius]|uniref:HpcH/HpaI aldolase/citrate lyase family protein n=1 Tax=Vibrio neptunius TaxID=170651 RepID=UPI0005F9F285|nr:HpcH/HpaI aldolase/citrate lyase family protein [Vibrio neptunius]